MIGDWVYNKHHGKNIRLTPYDFFTHTHNEFGEQRLVPYATPTIGLDLEPIPLTPEVFEKNGFEKRWQDIYEYFNDDENLNITFYPKSSNYTNGAYDYINIEKGCLTINEMPIAFVHELQQALRLCGISKEIEL